MSTPASFSSEAYSPAGSASTTSQLLEQRTLEIIRSVNTLDVGQTFPRYATDDFLGTRELTAGNVYGYSMGKTIAHIEGFAQVYPEYTIQPLATSVDLDDNVGSATVWVTCLLKHGPQDLEKETVSIFAWRREDGIWRCFKHSLLNGMPPMPH